MGDICQEFKKQHYEKITNHFFITFIEHCFFSREKNKDRIKFLLGEGLSIQTVANLNESQLIVLSEKFKKNKIK